MFRTIPDLLDQAADLHGDRIWLRTDDGESSFVQARAHVARTKGDLVVVTARTTAPYLLVWLALTSMGAIAVTANPASTPTELEGLLAQTQPRALVSDAEVGDLVGDWTADAPAADGIAGLVSHDDVAVLIPTSGTTGRSKLVMQTHRAYAMAGEGFPWWLDLTSDDVLMTALPLFHLNAPAYSVMGSLACGAGLVLQERFSASGFLDAARRHGATEFNAIGAMVEILMRQPPRADDAEAVFNSYATDEEVARYMTWRPHTSIAWTEEFLRRTWAWKQKYGGEITRQLRRLGASCDTDIRQPMPSDVSSES